LQLVLSYQSNLDRNHEDADDNQPEKLGIVFLDQDPSKQANPK
jgi:hypothetical protein